jgi:hypothetical protein
VVNLAIYDEIAMFTFELSFGARFVTGEMGMETTRTVLMSIFPPLKQEKWRATLFLLTTAASEYHLLKSRILEDRRGYCYDISSFSHELSLTGTFFLSQYCGTIFDLSRLIHESLCFSFYFYFGT